MSTDAPRPLDVLTVGDLNPDVVVTDLQSLEPRLGQEQYFGAMERTLGGSGALTSVTLARLGCRVAIVAQVGDDEPGRFCRQVLEGENVVPKLVVNPRLPTGITIAIAYPRDRMLLTMPGAIVGLRAADVDDATLLQARHVHVSSYFMQRNLRAGLADLFARAHRLGLTTSLDPGWDPEEQWLDDALSAALAHTDVFLPNAGELTRIAGGPDRDKAANRLLALGAGAVVMKNGAGGSSQFSSDGRVDAPGFAVVPKDTTGAGDAFDAGYIAAMLEGWPVRERLRFGNACGALVTQVSGGAGGHLTRQNFDRMYEGGT